MTYFWISFQKELEHEKKKSLFIVYEKFIV